MSDNIRNIAVEIKSTYAILSGNARDKSLQENIHLIKYLQWQPQIDDEALPRGLIRNSSIEIHPSHSRIKNNISVSGTVEEVGILQFLLHDQVYYKIDWQYHDNRVQSVDADGIIIKDTFLGIGTCFLLY